MTVHFIPELAGIVPYQPGLPIEVVQRRFGLEQVVKQDEIEFFLDKLASLEVGPRGVGEGGPS